MADCPYNRDHSLDVSTDSIGLCKSCSKVAWLCPRGHWNSAFGRYCTTCGDKLNKPTNWEVPKSHFRLPANQQSESSKPELELNRIAIKPINASPTEILPPLLAFDGVTLVPNITGNRIDAYTLHAQSQVSLTLQPTPAWSIEYRESLSLASTPIYYKLHLYYITGRQLLKKSVQDHSIETVNLNNVNTSQLELVATCCPLRFYHEERMFLAYVLEDGLLLYNLDEDHDLLVPYQLNEGDFPRTPIYYDNQIVLTTKLGSVVHINFETKSLQMCISEHKRMLSAPVVVNEKIYAESLLTSDGTRHIATYDFQSQQMTEVAHLNQSEANQELLVYPPLADNYKMCLGDRTGRNIYVYDTQLYGTEFAVRIVLQPNFLSVPEHYFLSSQSVLIGNYIYSVSAYGLTVFDCSTKLPQHQAFAPTGSIGNPSVPPNPISAPIVYGNKLLILCKDQLALTSYY